MVSDREALAHLEHCFEEGEIESLVRYLPGEPNLAIKVIHRPTGIESISERHTTQVRNKLQALLDLASMLLVQPSREKQA
jgi:hypothetical protein